MMEAKKHVRFLEERCKEAQARCPEPFTWNGEVWPSIARACLATQILGAPYTETLRIAPSTRIAREGLATLNKDYGPVFLSAQVRRLLLLELLHTWRRQHDPVWQKRQQWLRKKTRKRYSGVP